MIKINEGWLNHIGGELNKQYIEDIESFLYAEAWAGKTIYPEAKNILNALEYTSFEAVKVVIIGQDPYHGADQAHGLSFSVPEGVKIPPSLRNIFKELEKEGFSSPSRNGDRVETSGSLVPWARQGVLLLNSVLTVEAGRPASHSKIGWQNFTDEIIKIISAEKKGVVFLLWGAFAIGKKELIDSEKHLILTSPHPSPFSAYKGFFGNMHFLETNKYLKQLGKSEIKW